MSVEVSHDLMYAAVGNVMVKTNISSAAVTTTQAAVAPTTPVEKQEGSSEIAPWGDDNMFPTKARQDAEENTSLMAALEKRAQTWYGGGLVYGTVTINDKGEEVFTRSKPIPEIDAFLERSSRYLYEELLNISFFYNGFPELILTKDRQKVWSLVSQDAEFCRFSKQEKDGTIRYVFIDARFREGKTTVDKDTAKLAVIDPYFEDAAFVKQHRNEYKYVYPISVPTPGKTIYQLASWNTVRRSGWLDVAKMIPAFKKQMFINQYSFKYLVEIHQLYWEFKYPDWDAKTERERLQIIKDELKAFNDTMTGTDGAGKSVFSLTFPNPMNKNEYLNAFKVTAIDDKIKSGQYIEDSQEAASHVYTAVGMPPTLMGVSPGKGMGAGSGSDARVAFNNFISTSKFIQDLVLEPLKFIKNYNNWPAEIVFRIKAPLIMTLDEGKSSQQETA